MSDNQKSTAQRIAELELRLRRERGKEATELAKLLGRCARLLHRACPYELRSLIVKHVSHEEWEKLRRLGINEHLAPRRGPAIQGTTGEIASVVPQPPVQDYSPA